MHLVEGLLVALVAVGCVTVSGAAHSGPKVTSAASPNGVDQCRRAAQRAEKVIEYQLTVQDMFVEGRFPPARHTLDRLVEDLTVAQAACEPFRGNSQNPTTLACVAAQDDEARIVTFGARAMGAPSFTKFRRFLRQQGQELGVYGEDFNKCFGYFPNPFPRP